MTATPPQDPILPPAPWSRVIALTAQALPSLATPPPALRKVASFAASRRVRLGGAQIAEALADDGFREAIATQVAGALPDLARAVHSGTVGEEADPVDVAAVSWLLRPDGWSELVDDAVRRIEARQDAGAVARDQAELVRLRSRVAEAETVLRDHQSRQREAVGTLKAENAELRRKLGEARAGERSAQSAAETARAEAEQERTRSAAAVTAAETEARRLRGQAAELTQALATARRAARGDRDDATVRARLLLDTLIEAGLGLRRELALPAAAEGTPADRLEAELAEPSVRTTSTPGASQADSPALLEQYLRLPRARLVVDGYNVTKRARPDASLEAQRSWLLTGLAAMVARTGADTIVVFDAADSAARPLVTPPRGVKVAFSPPGVIADDVIRDLVAVEPAGRVVVVVTSDREVADDVRRSGARVVSAAALTGLLSR